MAIKESKKLQLVFTNSTGGENTLSPKYFREDITAEELSEWMDEFCELGIFQDKKQNILYTAKKAARIVETRITNIFGE